MKGRIIVQFGWSIFPPHQPDLLHVKKELPRQRILWEEIGLKFNWWLGQYATAIKLLWKSSLLFYTEVTWLCLDNTMCVNSVSSLLNPLWVKASLWCQWARCRPATPLVLPPPSYLHGLYTHPHWEGLEFSRSSNSTSCLYFFPVTSHMISSHFHYESLPALKTPQWISIICVSNPKFTTLGASERCATSVSLEMLSSPLG